jgi:hypothetical protein
MKSSMRPCRVGMGKPERSMPRFKDYQKQAADCLQLAQQVSDPTNKAMLLEMAKTWIGLAEQELAKSNDGQK